MRTLEILEPKYSTKRVLLACFKVGEHNKVVFTRSNSMGTEPYYVSGKVVRKYPKVSNGSIDCFNVPLSELEPLELNNRCEHSY